MFTVKPVPWAMTSKIPSAFVSAKFIVGTFTMVPTAFAGDSGANGNSVFSISLLFPITGILPVVKLPLNINPLEIIKLGFVNMFVLATTKLRVKKSALEFSPLVVDSPAIVTVTICPCM